MSNESVLIPKLTPETQSLNQQTEKVVSKKKFLNKKIAVGIGFFIFLILIYLVPSTIFGFKAYKEYKDNISPVISSLDLSDLGKLQNDLVVMVDSTKKIKNTFKIISWMKITPFLGTYISDLDHAIEGVYLSLEGTSVGFDTISPYLATLGFNTQAGENQSLSGEVTAQERIDFIVSAIPEIAPKAKEISDKFAKAKMEFSEINPDKYPETINGLLFRQKLKKGLDLFDNISFYVSRSGHLLEVTPELLGIKGEKRYLVLFQNDKELRPTGGFLTAYSIMSVKDAKFEPVDSADIYHLDAVYKPNLPAPQPIIDLIKGPYVLSQNIRLRDSNYSPDFEVSMDLFSQEAKSLDLGEYDGIIAVDTHLLVNLLKVLGEIGVPGFGNYSTKIIPECNCPQVIYELESFADTEGPIVWDPVSGKIVYTPPNYDNRKKIIGPLMNSILANALAQPKEKLPDLFKAIIESVMEKHVLFYFFDDNAQEAVSEFGVAGNIRKYEQDYIHINDSNLGGRKSNLYTTSEVEQNIELTKEGKIRKILVLTYKNPEKHDGWLNSVLPNWVRVYVPQGSVLVDVQGLEKQYDTLEELGKTVFSGYFKLRPEGVSKVIFTYELPFTNVREFKMLIQKQPGTDKPLYRVITKDKEEEFLLNLDREIRIKI